MMQLGLDIVAGRDGLGDLRADHFPEALAQPVHRDLHRAFVDAEPDGGIRLRAGDVAERQPRLDRKSVV